MSLRVESKVFKFTTEFNQVAMTHKNIFILFPALREKNTHEFPSLAKKIPEIDICLQSEREMGGSGNF